MTNTDPTTPKMFASLVSPQGEVIELFETPAYGYCTVLRYNPKNGETAKDAWIRSSEAVAAGASVCGNHQYHNRSQAYHMIGHLVIEQGWTNDLVLL